MRATVAILSAVLMLFVGLSGVAPVAAEEPVWTKGTVTKIKPDEQKVTIRHEEISNLDMPAMKMIFRVEDAAVLEKLKPGDEREFYFVKKNGQYMVKQVKE